MKRYIAGLLAICLLAGITLPAVAFADADADVQQTDYQEMSPVDSSDSGYASITEIEKVYISEDAEAEDLVEADTEEAGSETVDTAEGGFPAVDTETEEPETEKLEVVDTEEKEPETVDAENDATECEGVDVDDFVSEELEAEPEIWINTDDVDDEDSFFFYIIVDDERNVTVISWPIVEYEVTDEYGEGDITIIFKPEDREITINEDDFTVDLPDGWIYEIDTDNYTVIISPLGEEDSVLGHPEIFISLDDNQVVTVEASLGIDYEIVYESEKRNEDEHGSENESENKSENSSDILVIFTSDSHEIEIDEEYISVDVPRGWGYKIEADISGDPIIVTLSDEQVPGYLRASGLLRLGDEILEITHEASNRSQLQSAIGTGTGDGRTAVIAIRQNFNHSPGGIGGTGAITIPLNNNITIVSDPRPANNPLSVIYEITQNANGRHFIVNGQLTLVNITLTSTDATGNVGRGGVEVVSTGQFTMKNGSTIRNSRWTNGTTGAVWVNNGSFTMDGGMISQNTTHSTTTNRGGAGVYVRGTNAQFILNDGIITNNHVPQSADGVAQGGGGVAVDMGGTFNMYGGEITWNTVTPPTGTIYQGGGGVLVGRDGTAVTATSNFFMYGGVIASNTAAHATNASDTGAGEGGGVFVGPRGNFRMEGGAITNNFARSNGRGGGGVMVLGGRFATANPADGTITEKIIANNRARGGGGGIMALRTDPSAGISITGGISGEVTIAPGTKIRNNRAGLAEDITNGAGLGGGIHMRWGGTLIIEGGEIYNNTALRPGGGVAVGHDSIAGTIVVTMTGGKIFGNHARGDIATAVGTDRGNGGGISVAGAATWNMAGGEITNNRADNDGGGVRVSGGVFNMQSGKISDNIANNGGGLFVPHANLNNVTIAQASVFTGNIARNGMRVDNVLADQHYPRINPGTVSVAWINTGSGPLTAPVPHAFTNYDINTEGTQLWRVTYAVGDGDGSVSARVTGTEILVPNGYFVLGGTEVTFTAVPAPLFAFERWDIGTRLRETTDTGDAVDFDFSDGGGHASISRIITINTHAIGHFEEMKVMLTTLTVSKTVTGTMANRNKAFDFTVTFRDVNGNPLPAGTQFNYIGDIIAGSDATAPPNGVLTLDGNGSAIFALGHGQVIVIKDVALDNYVQIVEAEDLNYTASFIDSEAGQTVVIENDTASQVMTEDRIFSFTNERIIVPHTGITLGDAGEILMLAGLVSVSALSMFAISIAYRRRNVYIPKRAY